MKKQNDTSKINLTVEVSIGNNHQTGTVSRQEIFSVFIKIKVYEAEYTETHNEGKENSGLIQTLNSLSYDSIFKKWKHGKPHLISGKVIFTDSFFLEEVLVNGFGPSAIVD